MDFLMWTTGSSKCLPCLSQEICTAGKCPLTLLLLVLQDILVLTLIPRQVFYKTSRSTAQELFMLNSYFSNEIDNNFSFSQKLLLSNAQQSFALLVVEVKNAFPLYAARSKMFYYGAILYWCKKLQQE